MSKRQARRVGWEEIPPQRRQDLEMRVLKALVPQRAQADPWIGMAALYEAVFEEPCEHAINDSRELRHVITAMRREGTPIVSSTRQGGHGYKLAEGPGELEAFCARFRKRGLASLSIEAAVRRLALPELLGQMALEMKE